MGRETLRQRERRAAHFRVRHEGLADRAPVDAATVQRCLRGLDKHNCNHFGVRACVRMELDGLHEPPSHAWCGGTRCLLPWPAVGKRTTFIAYAAWRRRDPAVKQLIVGGADPTVSEAAAEGCAPAGLRQALHSVAPRSAVYAVAQIVRLRSLANREAYFGHARPAACDACGARPGEDGGAAARCGPLLRCAPCGCVCCERCLWSTFCEPPQSQSEERGEVRCGACRASLHTPGGEEAEEGEENGGDEAGGGGTGCGGQSPSSGSLLLPKYCVKVLCGPQDLQCQAERPVCPPPAPASPPAEGGFGLSGLGR
mmetsp:Transcript_33235/g.108663  ORF Transcript_33235/g.108663 Transcript_33235/m.108663 type:complete len:312 (+) Transcript_33235:73-1008(+)